MPVIVRLVRMIQSPWSHSAWQGSRVSDSDCLGGVTPEPAGLSLREVRAVRLLSMRDLARLARVALSTIFLIEAGRSTPHLSVVRRLSAVLEIDPQAVTEFRQAIRAHGGLR